MAIKFGSKFNFKENIFYLVIYTSEYVPDIFPSDKDVFC